VATGEYVWATSYGMLFDEDNRCARLRITNNNEINLEEGSCDSTWWIVVWIYVFFLDITVSNWIYIF